MKAEDLKEGMLVKDDYGNTLKCIAKLKTVFKFTLEQSPFKNPYDNTEIITFDKAHLKFLQHEHKNNI